MRRAPSSARSWGSSLGTPARPGQHQPASATLGPIVFLLVVGTYSSCSPLRPELGPNSTMSSDVTLISGPLAGCQLYYLDDNFQYSSLDSGAASAVSANQSASTFAKYITSGGGPQQQQQPPQQQQQQQVNARLTQQQQQQLQQQQQQQQQQSPPVNIGLECQFITAEQLHDKFNRIKASGLRVSSLVVRDSTLTTLGNLPQGFHELKKLAISNTSIDLEVLKEGSESLDQLTTLEIANEKISNIPQNFFQEMQSLRELRLENDEIASLDGDAFHNLDDSLEVLVLRNNRFNRFPMAVKNLAQLAVLDLSDNEIVIDTQENDLPEKLEPLLNLRELVMNRINCTCEFSSSPFFEWIARTHISGVRCAAPEKLKSQEVIVFERDEFCAARQSSSSAALAATGGNRWPTSQNKLVLVVCQLISLTLATSRLARSQCGDTTLRA